jgi:hypothetical protein
MVHLVTLIKRRHDKKPHGDTPLVGGKGEPSLGGVVE